TIESAARRWDLGAEDERLVPDPSMSRRSARVGRLPPTPDFDPRTPREHDPTDLSDIRVPQGMRDNPGLSGGACFEGVRRPVEAIPLALARRAPEAPVPLLADLTSQATAPDARKNRRREHSDRTPRARSSKLRSEASRQRDSRMARPGLSAPLWSARRL